MSQDQLIIFIDSPPDMSFEAEAAVFEVRDFDPDVQCVYFTHEQALVLRDSLNKYFEELGKQ